MKSRKMRRDFAFVKAFAEFGPKEPRSRLLADAASDWRSQLTFIATAEESASIWKKSITIRDPVLDEHPLCVAIDQLRG